MKDYFSHDYNARNDTKLIRVFMKYGLEGIGAYWCIVEMLYEEGGYLKTDEYERITFELRTEYDIIKSIIEDYELFENDSQKFWSDTAIERLKQRAEKSVKARESIQKRWDKYERNTNVKETNNEGNTSKGKESKVNKSKVNIAFDEFWNLYDKKVGDKSKLEKKWNNLKDIERQNIMEYTPIYKISQPDKKFRKNPETFLNNKSWNDEIIQESKAFDRKRVNNIWENE